MGFRDHPLRQQLLAIYAQVEALTSPISCDASADCCRFGVTGKEPHPTAIELEEVRLAVAARGGAVPKAEGDDCPFLRAGRCTIYASRPFGCRTFFCSRASEKPPRAELARLGREVLALSERYKPRDPGPRPLRRSL